MFPSVYCNIEVRGTATQGHGAMIAPVLSTLMSVLHRYFAKHPQTFALDLPMMKQGNFHKPAILGNVVRVFSNSRASCDDLLEVIDGHVPVSQYVMTGRVWSLPEYDGPWASLHRLRIAPRTQPDNRHVDLQRQESLPSPYLTIHSSSTGQNFSLLLERRRYPAGHPVTQGVLNSYGLSGVQPVYLPDMPL